MKEQKRFKIGITGVMGSGKSLVGQILTQAGVVVLDTDEVVHQLYESPDVIAGLVEHFGKIICETSPTGGLKVSRPALAKLVFGAENKSEKIWLEQFIHPRVRQKTEQFLNTGDGVKAVLVPLLFESESAHLYDAVWVVTIKDEAILFERLKKRHPNWTDDEINTRLQGQWSQAEKIKGASACIDNSDSAETTRQNVLALLHEAIPSSLLKAM